MDPDPDFSGSDPDFLADPDLDSGSEEKTWIRNTVSKFAFRFV